MRYDAILSFFLVLNNNYNKWFRVPVQNESRHIFFISTDVLNAFVFILALSVDFLSFAESCCVLTHLWFHQFEFNDIRVESNTYCNWEQQHAQAKTVPFFFFISSLLFVCSLHVLISLLPFHNSSKKTIKTNHWCFVSLCYPTNILIRCSVKPLIFLLLVLLLLLLLLVVMQSLVCS